MLKNPAYKGMAAFGKTKSVSKKRRLKANKGQSIQSKNTCSVERTPKDKWIFIPVPSIVDEHLFDVVQEQLEENKRLKRQRKTGARYLLQGLVVCSLCGYGYCGNTAAGYRKHNYYSCGGTRVYANRDRMCDNQSIHADILEKIAWEEVKKLLNNPHHIEKEYQRRINELEKNSEKNDGNKLKAEKLKLEKSIARLIDSYTESVIEKNEFEPRIKSYKKRLSNIEQQLCSLTYNQTQKSELQILIGKIEDFATAVKKNLEEANWQIKREIFEALIKQVEIGRDQVNIIFRISPLPSGNSALSLLEDCRSSGNTGICYCFAITDLWLFGYVEL